MEPSLEAPKDPVKQPWLRRHKPLVIGALVAFLVIWGAVSAAVIVGHQPSKTGSNSDSTSTVSGNGVALADSAKVDPNKLPAAKTLFFTMMQRTATQQHIGGQYVEAYTSPSQNNALVDSHYQERDTSWQHGQVSLNFVDLPWNPSEKVYSLTRCANGVSSTYNSFTRPPAWVDMSASGSQTFCNTQKSVETGKTNIDGILAGGLTKDQVKAWVNTLASTKSKVNGSPLLSFGTASMTTLNGQKVIALTAKVNAISNASYCSDLSCGQEILRLVLQHQHVDTDKIGYTTGEFDNSSKATYYLDPQTLLPVQSEVTTYDQQGALNRLYRRLFSFTRPPDITTLSPTLPAANPPLLDGIIPLPSDLPEPAVDN